MLSLGPQCPVTRERLGHSSCPLVPSIIRLLESRHQKHCCTYSRNHPPLASVTPACPVLGAYIVQPRQQRRRNPPLAATSGSVEPTSQELWSPDDLYREGAQRLQALMDELPELAADEAALGALLSGVPDLVARDPKEVRSALEALASALAVSLPRAARLAARVPLALESPAGEVAAKVQEMASELGVGLEATLDLYGSQPGIWAVSKPSIIKDRLDTLATKLGLPLPAFVELVGRQALLWVIPPTHVAASVGDLANRLGLTHEQAKELVARAPPILAVEPRLLKLGVQGVSATTGVPVSVLLDLLSRSLGLVAVPGELLTASLERLSADLGCRPEDVVGLMTRQPTLLCAQYGTIQAALETLEVALAVDRHTALAVLSAQPSLLYETTADTLVTRVEALASTFNLSLDEARSLGSVQPALLVVAPATVRSAVSVVGASMGSSLAQCLELARSDPGSFMMVTLQESLLEAWAARLELPVEAISQLLSAQPALLELTPTTVKARLESLAALFGVPLEIVAQLVLKHAALAAVPPNATITRAKNISMALRISMQGAASIIAKEPAMLAILAHAAAELRGSGGVADGVSEVGAVYEYYTMEWLQRQLKEMQPARVTSFASLDT